MNKFSLASALAIALFAAPAAQAADGTIEFTGAVTAITCKINAGQNDFSVTLPTVSTSALSAEGQVAGRTPFKIEVSDCQGQANTVSAFFEADESVNPATSRLFVDANGGLGAKKVEVALLNDRHEKILVGASADKQNSQTVDLSSGNATLNYYAQYEATGVAEAGEVKTRVRYTMSYE